MYKNDKISAKQLNILMITSIFGTGIIILPRLAFEKAGFSSFLFVALAGFFAFICAFIIKSLINLFPDKSFYEYCSIIIGKPIAFLLTIGFVTRLVIHIVLTIKLFLEITKYIMLPNTPFWIISFAILVVSAFGASKGYEARGAMAEIFMPIVIIPILVIYVFAMFHLDYNSLLSLINSLSNLNLLNEPIISNTLFLLYAFTGVELLLLARPYVNKKIKIWPAISILTFIMVFVTIITHLRFGEYTISLQWPVIDMMDITEIPGAFIQRQGALMMSFFIISIFSITNACLFFSSLLMKSVFKKGSHGFYVLLIAVLCFALLFINIDIYDLLHKSFLTFGIAYMFVIPLVLFIVAKLFKRAVVLIALIFLVSCGKELSERDFIVSFSIENNTFTFKTEEEVKKTEANSLEEAIEKINENSTKTLYFGFTQTVVLDYISEKSLKELSKIRDLSTQIFVLTKEQMPTLPARDEVPKKFKERTLENFLKTTY
ncbi:MAG: spore germination protein [Defluviitaleaceae bacterium]|nr:spore germination protein [Defluviitaleaceae bacterium]